MHAAEQIQDKFATQPPFNGRSGQAQRILHVSNCIPDLYIS